MANEIIPIAQQINNISVSMRQRMAIAAAANRAFASNVVASYPLLSIRGKEFTFRLPDGRSTRHEANGFALPFIDVVLVEGSQLLSKTYYMHGFDPNEFTRPDCWSLDSIKPDPSSPALQSVTCAICPQNVFGSKVTDAGKKIKACQDYRRVVVLLPHQVGSELATPMSLRVPQSSLKNLKAHAELLERYGVDVKACITRLQFSQEAYPQLVFGYVNILSEQHYDWVAELSQSPLVQGMVYTPDFENAVATPQQQTPGTNEGLKPQAAAPVPEAFEKLMGVAGTGIADETVQHPGVSAQQAQPAAQQASAAAQQPDLQAVPSHLIELPDGQLFDPTTGEYVERPAPKVDMPALDPTTITLPDGRFFNPGLKAFVTGPELGAPAVGTTAATQAQPAKRSRVKPKPAEAKPAAAGPVATGAAPGSLEALAAASAAQAQAQPQQQAQPAPVKPETKQEAKKPGNGHATAVVPATAALDDVIREAMGKTTES